MAKTVGLLQRLLPTIGRKVRLEVEIPAYLLADAQPLLQGLLFGLVNSGTELRSYVSTLIDL